MRLIIKLTFLLACSFSFAQFDSSYQAILDEATTNGYILPNVADQIKQNQIIVSAKASGIWLSSDLILYFKGSGDKNFKLINWKNPTGAKATEESYGGALTWTSTGVKGDGLNVINTHFDPSVGGLNYTQNDAGFYTKVSEAYTTKFTVSSGANISLSTTLQRPEINTDGTIAPIFTFPGTGLLGVSRNNATSYIVSVGAVLTTLTHASGNIGSETIGVLGNNSTTVTNPYTRFDGEVAYAIIGADMSDKLADIETAFDTTSTDTEAPTAPTLSSSTQIDTTVDLSWTAATDNTAVTGYKIYKNGVLEATLGNVLTYQVTGLTASTPYSFTVTAIDAAGNESADSNTITITTNATSDTQAPTAPTLSSSTQTDATIGLSWIAGTDNIAVTGYKVYKDAVLESTLGNVLSYQVAGLTASTVYNFTVTALDAAGNESADSNTLAITTDTTSDTQAPAASTLSSTAQTDTTVDLSWTAATDNIAVTNYKVYKNAVLETTLGNVLTYQVTGLTAATAYNFTVTALDAAGNESVVSNAESITTNAASGGGSGNWTLNNQDVYYNTGNVGIGTTTPDEKLAVNGNIHAKEIRVDLNNWPDYVFTKEYDLPTLKQVAEYIKRKGHLPNIPSAKEVEENGILLGVMNAKLLEKIEELTLYILQLNKELEAQKEQIKNLEKN